MFVTSLRAEDFRLLAGGSGDGMVESADPIKTVSKRVVEEANPCLGYSNILPNNHLLILCLQEL